MLRAFLSLIIFFLASCAPPPPPAPIQGAVGFSSSSLDRIAVLVEPVRSQRGAERLIEDVLIADLISKGYSVASRSDIDLIVKELGFQRSGWTASDAARIGEILNVRAVFVASVTSLDTERSGRTTRVVGSMGGRLVSVEKAEIFWIHSVNYRPIMYSNVSNQMNGALQSMARSLISRFPRRGSV